MERKCRMCGTYKEESDFYKNNGQFDMYCKCCRREYIFIKDYEKTMKARKMMEEERYFNDGEIMKFLGIDYEFEKEGRKEYPFNNKLEDIKFMCGYIVIQRYGIEKIIQNKISDKEYRDILQKITMLINIPFICKDKPGVITTDVSLTFRYDKEYKYGDVKKSIAEVCYAIERYGTKTNNFYIIKDEWFNDFMSYFVINNQWGIGATTVVSAPVIKFDNDFNEIRENGL